MLYKYYFLWYLLIMLIRNLMELRHLPAEEIVAANEDSTRELFETASRMEHPDIVIIPACNEQRDLPATLLSLSRASRPVIPVVVENGSNAKDKTFEYAERMGAIALHCEPAKMRATQIGLQFARDRFPEQPVVHFGDADNLYPRICLAAIAEATQKANIRNQDNGALVFGMGAYDHGSSVVVDLMRSGRVLRKAISRQLKSEAPMPYGFNYALHLGEGEELAEAMYTLSPLLFVREESEICKVAISAGAIISQLVRPSAYVLTRGDLIKSREEWRDFKGASMDTKTKYYKRSYPEVDFEPNSNGREPKG
jgi:hypothetical protein